MSNHNEAVKVIKSQMILAMNEVRALCAPREHATKEKAFKSLWQQLEYRNQNIMARFGFTFLGAGARRIGFSYTHNGVVYIVKGDKEPNDFILNERVPTGNMADWIANETLVKMYPVLKPLVAVIYGGFDIDDCLFLVQEPIVVADECSKPEHYNALHTPSNKERKRVLSAVVNDIGCNGQNYGVDSDGNLKVSDLDRFEMEKAQGQEARIMVGAYERWEKSQLQNQ